MVVVQRPARRAVTPLANGELVVHAPPGAPGPAGSLGWWSYLLPVMGAGGAMVFVLVNPKPVYLVAGGLFLVASVASGVAMFIQQRTGQRRRLRHERERYLAYVDRVRAEAREVARRQREDAWRRHPAPEDLWTATTSAARVWERRPGDGDFLHVRVGLGARPLAWPLRIDASRGPLADLDPVCAHAAHRLVSRHASVDDLPLTLDLSEAAVVRAGGPGGRSLARALVCQAASFHPPEDLRIVLCAAGAAAGEWGWVKWLPHAQVPRHRGQLVPVVARSLGELRDLLEGDVEERRADHLRRRQPADPGVAPLGVPGGRDLSGEQPRRAHLLVILDGCGTAAGLTSLLGPPGGIGLSIVEVGEPPADETADVALDAGPGGELTIAMPGRAVTRARADRAGPRVAEALARTLAPLRLSAGSQAGSHLADTVPLARLLGIAGAGELDTGRLWRDRPIRERLRVPLGLGPDGEPILLDLKESALGGMGPHGLVVGATGSGKSELLRTIVTGLVASHPPELLSLVLIDFKGGATFAGMARLPHVAGVITNLQDDLALVDRMRDALFGEQLRRQELLRRAGNLDSAREYQRVRAAGRGDLEPMPFLLIIVDEFGELLASRPDFIELFVAIGRVGRSLGIHLLLASQRLDEGRLRGLESHLSYRIALRVFSAMESRAVLGVPDAYTLPPVPGSAYLKVDAAAPLRFKVASASAPLRAADGPRPAAGPGVSPFTALAPGELGAPAPADEDPGGEAGGPSALGAVVDRLEGAAARAHQIWLPPLEPALTLDSLLPPVVATDDRGLSAPGWPGAGGLQVPLGLVDRPTEQAKEVLVADLSGAGGHLAVVGATQTGKSTLLRTLVCAFALTHTPAEVQFYGVDFGGGGLQALGDLPHVGTVCGRFEPERVRRVVGEMSALLDRRERLFRARAIDSVAAFRALRAAGALPGETLGDVFLLVDNWAAMRQEFEDLEPAVLDIAARGLGYGVHLVITANRWMEVRSNLRDSLAARLELRLNDPTDSAVDRRLAGNLPAGVPGRGLVPDPLLFQAALPRIDGLARVPDLPAALDDLVARVAAAWTGPGAPPARVLPGRLDAAELPPPGTGAGVPIGVAEPDLEPLWLDLAGGEPHFLVFGDGESGKTNLLRTYLAGLTARCRPSEAAVVVVDYRRTLLDAVHADFLASYAGSAPAVAEAVQGLHATLTARLPGPEVSIDELRGRAWWTGPELYVVVDDYDLVVTPTTNPLLPLLEFLAQARDVGVHLVVARRSGGASRALFEPVLQRLRDLGTPGLLLSGDRQEGPLLGGQTPMPQPPGRGILVLRREPARLVQVAWTPAAT
ncbi:MAG TPA: type VII secretion protein EccCb [Candidatus Dormibacteraeota bacterium]